MTTVSLKSPDLGPLTIEVLDERGKSLVAPMLMSSSQSILEIRDLPQGNLTIVATRPSGEQLLSPIAANEANVNAYLEVPGRSPHEFMSEATSLGLVRPRPPETVSEYLGLAPDRLSSLLISTVGGTAGRNLVALGASPVFASRSVAAFDGGLFPKSEPPAYEAVPDYHTLASWEWSDGRWRRTPLPHQNLNAGSAYLQLRLWGTETPMALGLLDGLGYGPIVIVPPFRQGIDITFLAEGLQSAVFGRRVDNPSAVRTPVALAVPLDRSLADLLVALSSPAMPQASQLWDQVAASHGSPADSAHAFLVDKYKDPTAATLGALFLARFVPGRVPAEWLRNLDGVAGNVADNAYLLAWAAMTRPSDRPANAAAIQDLIRTAQKRPLLYFSRTRAQLVQAARLYGPWTRSRRLELTSPRHPRQGDFLDYAADAGGLEAFWGASPSRPGSMPGDLPSERPQRNDEVRVNLVDGVFSLR